MLIKTTINIHQNAVTSGEMSMIRVVHTPPLHYSSMDNVQNSLGGRWRASGVRRTRGAENELDF